MDNGSRYAKLYMLLFAACVSVPFLNIYELTFAVWAATAAITINRRYSLDVIKLLSCFAAILLIAFIVSFFRDESTYNFFRDIAYLLKPLLGILIGYQICKKLDRNFLETIIYTGLFLAVVHLVLVGITFLRFYSLNVHLLREYCGYFSDYEVYVLAILMFRKQFDLPFSAKRNALFILIMAASSLFYLSRTNFIQLIILYVALRGFLVLNRRSLRVILTVSILVIGAYTAIYQSNPQRSGKGIEAFLYKIKIAPIEPFKTYVDEDDWMEFHDNYRSFENILTVKQVSAAGTDAVLFGKGLGATVNLGRKVWTNDLEWIQYIPILHNGFATVYLKSGLLGLLILLVSIYLVGKQKRSDNPMVRNINYLLLGTAFFLLVSNWVFMGFYLKLDNKSILVGLLICYREMLIRQNRRNIPIEA